MCHCPALANWRLVICHFGINFTGQDLSSRVREKHQVGKGPSSLLGSRKKAQKTIFQLWKLTCWFQLEPCERNCCQRTGPKV